MGAKLMGFARQDQRRARTQTRRLVTMLRQYNADPEDKFPLRSEAAILARRISVRIHQAEEIERAILTGRGAWRLALQATGFHM
jgi:hypothetical protein